MAKHLSVLEKPKDRLLYLLLSEKLMEVAQKGKADYQEKPMRELLEDSYSQLLTEEYSRLKGERN